MFSDNYKKVCENCKYYEDGYCTKDPREYIDKSTDDYCVSYEYWEWTKRDLIGETMKNKDDYKKEIEELIIELAIEKQKQIFNMNSELQVQTAIMDIQYQNAIMQTQLSFR